MTKLTVVFLLVSLICSTYGAPSAIRPENVPLSPEAQEIADALRSLLKADVISKVIQIFAAQGPNSHAYISSLSNITPEAAQCLTNQVIPVSMRVQSQVITSPDDAINAYLEACSQYRDQLEPMFTAFMGAMRELNATAHDNSDLPQSYQTFLDHYGQVMAEIQANPNATDNGQKLQQVLDEYKAIPESDAQIVAQKLPFYQELILPSGQVHADVVSLLEMRVAQLNGEQIDEAAMKETAQRVSGYMIQNMGQLLNYLKNEIDNYQIPADIANDESVTKIANAFGKSLEYLSNMLFNAPWFNTAMNALVSGKMNDFSQNNAIAA